MFARYTEKARRSIFFARYEASNYASGWIEAEHLLLGILREYTELSRRIVAEELSTQIEQKLPRGERRVATSVDMPLSAGSKRVLERGCVHRWNLALFPKPAYIVPKQS